ncbi:thiamine/thiamine pyrophosphate ABC transporter permease ThiP [Morganella morganii]|uniref:Thiamine transport system permease protein ThiP n=1 Tax=Morganella morganii TaxID=582 RepID=A0A433ZXH9_MORMO|nr:thiamine/thiamine pyrophosphate ABC transporter permease ThiP [Morganella morganii]RUT66854.1 thiamine/thiamine pyrophosphate ABC transporter permease ThiP [Morganella morganii]
MAKRSQSLIGAYLIPGTLASGLLLIVAVSAFGAQWFNTPDTDWQQIWDDSYLWHVVRFTFWQAFLSALFSVIPAVFLARALWRRRFPGRTIFLRLCAMTLVLPVLVAVFGILSVYGRNGWLAHISGFLELDYTFSPYGLQGILLAHIFFNMPLATRMLYQQLDNIAAEQRQLAAQLNMNEWQHFRIVEWPYLRRQLLPTAALIFMLCFASFATVLALGGGPAATTIELAIYQALNYDFDIGRAALLALIQLVCCLGLVLVSQRLSGHFSVGFTQSLQWRNPQDTPLRKLADGLIILCALLFLLPPFFAIITDGLNPGALQVVQQPALWRSFFTSLGIALASGFICVLLTMMLLWSSRELRLRQAVRAGQAMELSGLVILAMPGIVLATGFFLLLNSTTGITDLGSLPYGLVILTNALMAVPYALKVLDNPMRDLAERYNPLCLSLNISGFNRLKLIELRALRNPLAQAVAFASVLSVGDFGVIALFGNEDFRTLPFYLYQQIGAYRNADAAVTALILFLLCFGLFTILERLLGKRP